MRKLLQLFGGGVIAAVMVLIVIHIYSGNIIPALKEAGKKKRTVMLVLWTRQLLKRRCLTDRSLLI